MHFAYIRKVLTLPSNRLPHILACEVIRTRSFWAKDWVVLCETYQINITGLFWASKASHDIILERILYTERVKLIEDAKGSCFHDMYNRLSHDGQSLLALNFPSNVTSMLIKARGGLLNINARAFKDHTDGRCTICNLNATENTLHIIGICPIYAYIRNSYFGVGTLNENEVINILNGQNYIALYNYLSEVLKYRAPITPADKKIKVV